jgi:hypothetical protein
MFRDHVAEIDPDAEPDPTLFGHLGLTVNHPTLDLNGAAHGIHDTRKLGQQAVAGVLHNPAVVLCDLWLDYLMKVGLEPRVRTLLILAHEPRITGHVGGKDCGEAAG